LSDTIVRNHIISGEEIQPIIEAIESAIDGYDRSRIILALLCEALIISDPSISPDKLTECVKLISRYIVLMLDNGEEAKVN